MRKTEFVIVFLIAFAILFAVFNFLSPITLAEQAIAQTVIDNASATITNANTDIETLQNQGKDESGAIITLGKAKKTLNSAKTAFKIGDYQQVDKLAHQALDQAKAAQDLTTTKFKVVIMPIATPVKTD